MAFGVSSGQAVQYNTEQNDQTKHESAAMPNPGTDLHLFEQTCASYDKPSMHLFHKGGLSGGYPGQMS